MAYVAYHRHDSRSNIILADSVVTDLDYANRLKELGQDIMSCCNHGAAYNWKETQMIAAENKLRFRYVVEPYFVLDRFDKTDRTNAHLILAAKTAKGIGDLNEITSEAYISGFYHRPRIDMELLLGLSPEDVFVTTACVGGIWKYGNEKAEELVKTFKQHFGKSFMLEVQYHNTESQRELNRFILSLYRKHNIPLIMGTDSHYIYPEQGALRELRLEANGIRYDDEDGWYMDFPDEETCIQRFKEQGVLSPSQIKESIQNTLVFEAFEDVKLDKSKKLPNAYPELTEKEREQLYVKLVMEGYNRYYPNVTPEQREADMKELQYEMDTITQTRTADYFLSLYKIVQRGLEKGGVLTETGRGSAVSYATNRMLGLTSVNRLRIPVTLYPDRFISKDRLESGQLPDEDLNVSNLECFQDGGKEILGEWGCVPMVAYGKLGLLSAWKMYARAEKIPFEQSNAVSDMLKRYETALKYAKDEDEDEDEELDEEEEREERIKLSDFVKAEYLEMVEASRIYQGIVNSISPHPCAHLLLDRDIRREIGVVRLKKAKSKKGAPKKEAGEEEESEYIYAAMVDGSTADKCGYVKADFLRVDVVKLNNEIFRQAGIPQPNADEIIELTKNDPDTWSMYEKGFTVGLNQVEREKTTSRVMRFKPKNIVELSAFVAAIRPSFQSMLDTFLSRNRFTFGIPALDKLLQTPEIKSSFLVYQEQIFTVLMKAGISAPDAYTVIKAISKKKKDVIHSFQQQFLEGFVPYIMEDGRTSKDTAKKAAEETWKIIEDSASYSFNACVSGDTRIFRPSNGKWAPTVEEMYRVMNDKEWAIANGKRPIWDKYQRNGYGMARSMNNDNRVIKNRIVDIREAGVQDIYRVVLSDDKYIDCTMTHKFPTLSGEKKLSDLSVGDTLFVQGEYEVNREKHVFTDGTYKTNHPQPGQMGFQPNPDGESVKFKSMQSKKVKDSCPCEKCGSPFDAEERFELHHSDGNRTNNTPANLIWLCNSCHKKAHYSMGRVKWMEKGIPAHTVAIKSIEYLRTDTVYDVEMEDPFHNFVANDGIITSNSHAYCVAVDSLYSAYAKAHYPYEFYVSALKVYGAKQNKKKLSRVKNEARQAFGIKIVVPKFGEDSRSFFMNKAEGTISDALTSAKFISRPAAETLYQMGQTKEYEYFVDLMIDLISHGTADKRQQEILIKMGYFRDFGSEGKLLAVFEEFNSGKTRYDKKHSDKTKEKRIPLLRQMEQEIQGVEMTFAEKLKFETEYLGSPMSLFTDQRGMYTVLAVDEKYSPKIDLYNVTTGTTGRMKVRKDRYGECPLEEGDTIKIEDWVRKDAYSYVDGKARKNGEKELWILEYEKVS